MNLTGEENLQPSLCLSCGICCDGTLFDYVSLEAADKILPLVDFGIEIDETGGEKNFSQPCAAYQKNCCRVYADRPAACRKYRCLLLKKYENGDISREAAERQIKRVRQIKRSLETELDRIVPQSEKVSMPQLRKLMPENDKMRADSVLLKKWAAAAIYFSMLLDCLQNHFHLPENDSEPPAG